MTPHLNADSGALPALLDAYHRNANIRLVFRRQGVERSVLLLFRKVLFVNSTEKKDRLELLLATRKLLGKEDILATAGRAREQGIDFMTMVQREGALKDVGLVDVMTDRARSILIDLMLWSDAEVEYDARGFLAEPILPLNLELIPVLVEAMIPMLTMDDCRRLLGSEDYVPQRTVFPWLLGDLEHTAHAVLAKAIYERVDGKSTIADILQVDGDEILPGMKMLSCLKLLGAIDMPHHHAERAVAPPPPPPSEPEVEYEAAPAAGDLSSEEKSALANIFEGAANLLEDDEGDDDDLVVVIEEDDDLEVEVAVDAAPPVEVYIEDDEDDPEPASEAVTLGTVEEPAADEPAPVAAQADEELLLVDDDDAPAEAEADAPFESGETTEIRNSFNALLDIDPEEASRLFSAGLDFFRQGKIAQAVAVYSEAVDKDPSVPEYYSALGLAHLEETAEHPADELAALKAFQEAVSLDAALPKNHFYIGRIQERRGDKDAAVACYEEALARDAAYTPAREALDALRGGTAGRDKDAGAGLLRRLFGR